MKQYTNKQCDMPCLLFSSLSVYRKIFITMKGRGMFLKASKETVLQYDICHGKILC